MMFRCTTSLALLTLLFALPAAPAAGEDMEAAVRSVVAADSTAALVTVDAGGQPRIRSVDVRPLDNTLIFWVATKPNTRKVEQIRNNDRVALYFNRDAAGEYVSVMGTAVLVDDPETIARISWRDDAVRRQFWPDFPADYLLIKITPDWIEAVAPGLEADADTWRPQAMKLTP